MYIISILAQNEEKMECFSSIKELLARVGTLSPSDKVEQVFSLTYEGVLKKHKIVFTDRLQVLEVTEGGEVLHG